MNSNLYKRILTSFLLLLILLVGLFISKHLWLMLLLIASIILYNEFTNLVKKAFTKKLTLIYLFYIIGAVYLMMFIYTSYKLYSYPPLDLIFYISICVFSDTGGYCIGKLIGGKKLTKISPNKTISGSIGSFVFSLIPLIFLLFIYKDMIIELASMNKILVSFFLILFLSLVCQLGDLLISYLKRRAKVKDTGLILPGHGGLLDRLDGTLFVLPFSYLLGLIFF